MFWRKKIKELEYALDKTIEQSNDNVSRINNLEIAMKETQDALNELEDRVKNKWESLTKRVETCEKANEMFTKALNEQRVAIGTIIKYVNAKLKAKQTNTKKGAK